MITSEIDLEDDTMVIVKKDEEVIGKCQRFNNGFDEKGYPLPLEE
jgi:hypothetical protein